MIRDQRLYRAQYGTFETYCRERWVSGEPALIISWTTLKSWKTSKRLLPGTSDRPAPSPGSRAGATVQVRAPDGVTGVELAPARPRGGLRPAAIEDAEGRLTRLDRAQG